MSYNPNKSGLQFDNNVAHMAAQAEKGEALGSGSKLTLAVALIRNGNLQYVKNVKNDHYGWKGLKTTMALPELQNRGISSSDVSKACAVVQHYIPQVVTCDEDDVVSHVLAFVNDKDESGKRKFTSFLTAYDAINGKDGTTGEATATASAWNIVQAMATVVATARKRGLDSFAVQEAFEAAVKSNYGN